LKDWNKNFSLVLSREPSHIFLITCKNFSENDPTFSRFPKIYFFPRIFWKYVFFS
jgi:hypothetical protein